MSLSDADEKTYGLPILVFNLLAGQLEKYMGQKRKALGFDITTIPGLAFPSALPVVCIPPRMISHGEFATKKMAPMFVTA